MQELETLKFEINRDHKERKIERIKYALENYLVALQRQETEAKAKRSWWQKLIRR